MRVIYFTLLGFIFLSTGCSIKEKNVKEKNMVTSYYECLYNNNLIDLKLSFHKTTSSFKEKRLLFDILKKNNTPTQECYNYKRIKSFIQK